MEEKPDNSVLLHQATTSSNHYDAAFDPALAPVAGDLGTFLEDLILLRGGWGQYLPIRNSLIATDILLEILLAHCRSQKIQVKVLLNSLPHSRTGIDYHYRWLINEGWIEIVPCDKDLRVRYAEPTNKLLGQTKAMMEAMCGKLHGFIPRSGGGGCLMVTVRTASPSRVL